MRDFFAHIAVLAGILFFVGRLHVFPSLVDAFVAGLLATATAAIVLLACDTLMQAADERRAALGRSDSTTANAGPSHDA
jgi:hypothetical protein